MLYVDVLFMLMPILLDMQKVQLEILLGLQLNFFYSYSIELTNEVRHKFRIHWNLLYKISVRQGKSILLPYSLDLCVLCVYVTNVSIELSVSGSV